MRAVELEHTVPTVGWVRDPVEIAAGPLLKEQGFDTFYVPMSKRGDPTFCRQVLEEAPRAGRMQAARVLPLLEQHGISRRRLRDLKLGLPIMLPDGRERVDKTTPKLSEARRPVHALGISLCGSGRTSERSLRPPAAPSFSS